MEFKKQNLRHEDIPDGTPVRFNGLLGEKVKPASPETVHPLHVPVVFGGSRCIHNVHADDLETPVEAKPEPKKPEYRETNYYTDLNTGTLYFISGFDAIAINNVSPSLSSSTIKNAPLRYKRLYREA